MILETDRLTLRPFRQDDLAVLVDLFRSPDFMRFPGSAGYSREQTSAVLEKFLRWSEKKNRRNLQ